MNYQFSAELLSLVLLIILFFHALPRVGNQDTNQQLFINGLIFIGLSSLFNMVCLITNAISIHLPIWVHYLSNTTYFIITIIMANFFAFYAFEKILSHVINPMPIKISKAILNIINVLFIFCLIINLKHPFIFYFDETLTYTHGPFWTIGYIEIGFILLIVAFDFIHFFSYMDKACKQAFFFSIPVVFALVITQIIYPELLMNCTIATYTAIIFYFNFQSQPIQVDPLTKLQNRMSFVNDLRTVVHTEQAFEIIWLNLNDFGQLNRTHGFTIGDEVLFRISIWLQKNFPKTKIYRIAPNTFALLFEQVDEKKRMHNIDVLQNHFSHHWYLDRHDCVVNSFIVETTQPKGHHLRTTQIVEGMEYAQTTAKREGRSFICYDDQMEQVIHRHKYIYDILENAVEKKKFKVYLQPIWSVNDQAFRSAEALVRLQLDDGTFLSPEEFMVIAENSGLIDQVNNQILHEICNFLNYNSNLPIDHISMNLSLAQLQSNTFVDELRSMLQKHRIRINKLSLELTERMLISNNRTIQSNLKNLKAAGFKMSLDDFGTGYSNFASVLHLPIEQIKLDKSLIWDKENKANDYLTISTLTTLFHSFGKTVVCEGIETEEQTTQLSKLQVDHFQGFFYAKPMPMEQFRSFILKNDPSNKKNT